jgi:hypothetical protein
LTIIQAEGGIKGASSASFVGGVQTAMSDQPPEDLGTTTVLLVLAAAVVVLAIIAGVLVI